MEVIKNNFDPVCSKPVPSRKVRCKHCKSKLRITYEDIKVHYNTADILTSYYFKCPCCKATLYLSLRKGMKLKKLNGSMLTKLKHNPYKHRD